MSLDREPLPDGVIRFTPTGDTTGPMVEARIQGGRFSVTAAVEPRAQCSNETVDLSCVFVSDSEAVDDKCFERV